MPAYQPRPIDTSRVTLSADLLELVEQLAQNNHDQWALQRLKEGWRHGPARNDAAKEHPDLVRYQELSESEKAYDRTSVVETLKAILALGYQIARR